MFGSSKKKKLASSGKEAVSKEIGVAENEISRLVAEMDSLKQVLEEERTARKLERTRSSEEKQKLVEKLEHLQSSVQFERGRSEELASELEALRSSHENDILEWRAQIGEIESKANLAEDLEEQVESLKLQLQFYEEQKDDSGLGSGVDDAESDIGDANKDQNKSELEAQLMEANAKVDELQTLLDRAEASGNQLKTKVESLENELEEYKAKSLHPVETMSNAHSRNDNSNNIALASVEDATQSHRAEIEELRAEIDRKTDELVRQGEMNFSLSEKLQESRDQASQAREELNKARALLIRQIRGESVSPEQFQNVSIIELIRLNVKANTYTTSPHGRAAGVIFEAKRRIGGSDESETKDELANSSTDSLWESEVQALRQANKKLQQKVESLKSTADEGQKALEITEQLMKRNSELAKRFRNEKDMKMKLESDLERSAKRIRSLSEHIEKLMMHLKHEAAAKVKAQEQQKQDSEVIAQLKQNNASLLKKSQARERMMHELREGSRILEDQLRLMDKKYLQLRTKLDWTRASSNKQVKRIQKEANRLRARFALAYSTSSPILGNSMEEGYNLHTNQSDFDDGSGQSNGNNNNNNSSIAEMPSMFGKASGKDDDEAENLARRSSTTFDTSMVSSSGLSRNGSTGELPAIESIIHESSGLRYRPQ